MDLEIPNGPLYTFSFHPIKAFHQNSNSLVGVHPTPPTIQFIPAKTVESIARCNIPIINQSLSQKYNQTNHTRELSTALTTSRRSIALTGKPQKSIASETQIQCYCLF